MCNVCIKMSGKLINQCTSIYKSNLFIISYKPVSFWFSIFVML